MRAPPCSPAHGPTDPLLGSPSYRAKASSSGLPGALPLPACHAQSQHAKRHTPRTQSEDVAHSPQGFDQQVQDNGPRAPVPTGVTASQRSLPLGNLGSSQPRPQAQHFPGRSHPSARPGRPSRGEHLSGRELVRLPRQKGGRAWSRTETATQPTLRGASQPRTQRLCPKKPLGSFQRATGRGPGQRSPRAPGPTHARELGAPAGGEPRSKPVTTTLIPLKSPTAANAHQTGLFPGPKQPRGQAPRGALTRT